MIETLTQYTGDLSREQLLSAGYTEQQADEIMKLAETANDAATKVKTFSQLIDTTAEALGSGWASIFRTIFGDFERARTMWTAVSDVVNGGIGTFFDALQGILDRWDELGGWEEWWYGLGELWTAIAKPLEAIGEGFFSAFQGDAGKALYDFSYYFRHSISQWLMMSDDFANNLGKVFKMAGIALASPGGPYWVCLGDSPDRSGRIQDRYDTCWDLRQADDPYRSEGRRHCLCLQRLVWPDAWRNRHPRRSL